jgi:hypothetical protein
VRIIYQLYQKRQNRTKEKLKGSYIRLADGEIAEVVEDDQAPLEKRKRELID